MADLAKSALTAVCDQLKRYAIAYREFDGNLNECVGIVGRLGASVAQYRDADSLMHSQVRGRVGPAGRID